MSTKGLHKFKGIQLKEQLRKLGVDKLSKQVGFERRRTGKIKATNLLMSFFHCLSLREVSLHHWSLEIALLLKKTVVSKRFFTGLTAGS